MGINHCRSTGVNGSFIQYSNGVPSLGLQLAQPHFGRPLFPQVTAIAAGFYNHRGFGIGNNASANPIDCGRYLAMTSHDHYRPLFPPGLLSGSLAFEQSHNIWAYPEQSANDTLSASHHCAPPSTSARSSAVDDSHRCRSGLVTSSTCTAAGFTSALSNVTMSTSVKSCDQTAVDNNTFVDSLLPGPGTFQQMLALMSRRVAAKMNREQQQLQQQQQQHSSSYCSPSLCGSPSASSAASSISGYVSSPPSIHNTKLSSLPAEGCLQKTSHGGIKPESAAMLEYYSTWSLTAGRDSSRTGSSTVPKFPTLTTLFDTLLPGRGELLDASSTGSSIANLRRGALHYNEAQLSL